MGGRRTGGGGRVEGSSEWASLPSRTVESGGSGFEDAGGKRLDDR